MNDDTIFALAAQVGKALQDKGLLLATAESCTGGGVAQAITEIDETGKVLRLNPVAEEILKNADGIGHLPTMTEHH